MDTHYTSPACLVFHHINAYEEDGIYYFVCGMIVALYMLLYPGHIVVDVCALEDGSVAEITLDTLNQIYPESLKPKSRRYVLPLGGESEVC